MNELIFITVLIFVLSTYKLYQVIKIKEAPKENKVLAWTIYGASMLAIIALNAVFYT
ncbi:hypothetical protein [Virgibacillus kimchii]